MDGNRPKIDSAPLNGSARGHLCKIREGIDLVARLSLLIALGATGCGPWQSRRAATVLLFAGTGTSANDVAAFERLLKDRQLRYSAVTSHQLNGMSQSQLMTYRLLIVPGGNFIAMGGSLTPEATSNIHDAVHGGLNYLGVCAGGFLAGHGTYNSLNLTAGVPFGFYSDEKRGIGKTALVITSAGAPPLQHYWEDGPQFTGWGAVVGKYPDGTPAIVEGTSGKGWVVLSGVHPEAPESWRRGMPFTTPADAANAYAGKLIDAALHRTALPHY